jgi:hypothetical protein
MTIHYGKENFMDTEHSSPQRPTSVGIIAIPFFFIALLIVPIVLGQYPEYRTPGAKRTLVFEAAEFHVGPNFGGAKAVSDTQHYSPYNPIRQITAPNPNPDPDKGLLRFISEMDSTNIGLLYVHTHGFPGNPSSRPQKNKLPLERSRK